MVQNLNQINTIMFDLFLYKYRFRLIRSIKK